MGNLMIRRKEMFQTTNPTPSKPYPYSIDSWTKNVYDNIISASVDSGNRVRITINSTKTNISQPLNLINGTQRAAGEVFFTIPAGSTVTAKLTNISNPNKMPMEFYLYNGNTAVLSITRFTSSADQTKSVTVSTDTPINFLRLFIVRTGIVEGNAFECNLEVYVNGVRYI